MRGARGVATCAAAIGAALCCAVPSPAAAKPATFKSLTLTGSVTFTWTGDRARGCAANGLCGVNGELTLSVPSGSPESFSGSGLSYMQPDVTGVVRVRRASRGSVTECVEPIDQFPPPLTISLSRDDRSTLIQSTWSSGRCAGPLAGRIPSLRLPVRRSGGRHPSFDLSGDEAISAGPYAATVISTLRLSTSPPSTLGGYSSSSSGGFSGRFFPPPPVRRVRVEYVRLRYRLAVPPSALDVSFRGASDPSCEMLDSCGAAGALTLSLAPMHADVTLTASRVVNRHISANQALSDFRRGRLAFFIGAGEAMSGNLAETLHWGPNAACSDSRRASGLVLFVGAFPYPFFKRPTVPVALQDEGGSASDVFRTYCPGPSSADIFGAQPFGPAPTLAQGSLGRRQLLARQTSMVLSPAGSFSGLGYSGTRSGVLKLELTLTGVSAGTRLERR